MVREKAGPPGVIQRLEEKLGLPPLSQLSNSLDKFPDIKHLQKIKEVLETAERVSKSVPDLDKAVALVAEINDMSLERLQLLDKLLARLEKIIKTAPAEMIDFLTGLKEDK
jgi:hypothetical protein